MSKFLMIIGVLWLVACHDPYAVKQPELEVWVDQHVYAVGEEIRFHIEGDVDMIDFYSGTNGNDYAYSNKDREFDAIPMVGFRASKYAGNAQNDDCAALLITTEFDGNYDFDNVQSLNWIDISDRVNIPPRQGNAVFFYDGGTADLSDIVEDGKPFVFAWYCRTEAESARTLFQVADFTLMGTNVNDPTFSGVVASQAQMSFEWVLNDAAASQPSSLPSVTSQLIFWNGISNNRKDTSPPNTTPSQQHEGLGKLKEGYAISIPLTFDKHVNLGKDTPIIVKSIQTENLTGYTYTFDEPGEYDVTFVGYNVNYKDRKDVIKTIRITIVE